jgi:hypothetical protein
MIGKVKNTKSQIRKPIPSHPPARQHKIIARPQNRKQNGRRDKADLVGRLSALAVVGARAKWGGLVSL